MSTREDTSSSQPLFRLILTLLQTPVLPGRHELPANLHANDSTDGKIDLVPVETDVKAKATN